MRADLEPKGVGYSLTEALANTWDLLAQPEDSHVSVIGHSLGGAITMGLPGMLSRQPDVDSLRIPDTLVTFNSPGISVKLATAGNRLKRSNEGEAAFEVRRYAIAGDNIQNAGEMHLHADEVRRGPSSGADGLDAHQGLKLCRGDSHEDRTSKAGSLTNPRTRRGRTARATEGLRAGVGRNAAKDGTAPHRRALGVQAHITGKLVGVDAAAKTSVTSWRNTRAE